MPDDPNGHKVQVLRGAEFPFPDDMPIIAPLDVGTLGGMTSEGDIRDAMTVATIIPSQVAGLAEFLELHRSADGFDTSTRWVGVVPEDDPEAESLAVLEVALPKHGIRFGVCFSLEDHKHSLQAAARTGRVALVDPECGQALKTQPPQQAFRGTASMVVTAEEYEPLLRLLQQRYDLPLEQAPDSIALKGEVVGELLLKDAVAPAEIQIYTRPGSVTVLALRDPEPEAFEAAFGEREWMRGRWMVAPGDPPIARLECFDPEDLDTPLRAWIMPMDQPPARALSSGGHAVAVTAEALPVGQEEIAGLVADKARITVASPKALRTILIDED